jgi:hypothetical protein
MNVRRHCLAWTMVLAAAGWAIPALAAAPPRAPVRAKAQPFGAKAVDRVEVTDNQRRIDVNSLNMFVTNYGSHAWDLTTGNSGLIYPKGTTNTAIFASGIWLGATVGGEVRTVVAEYSQEYGPGKITAGGAFENPADPRFRVYKVIPWNGNATDTAHVNRSAEDLEADPVADPLLHHSWSEYINGAKADGAPTRMWDINGTLVEGPDVLGDQMLWCVYNDADQGNHTNDAGNSTALGVEIQQTTFAFNRQGALGNTVFLKYLIINKGANQLDDMFVSIWSDPDLGGAADDLVGCDTTLSLGYCYNANNADQLYGSAPPAVGYDFFLGPVDALGDTLPLTSFNKYINGTDPASTDETYNYMNGLLPDGGTVLDNEGNPTVFFHAGDPVVGTGWLDSNPADRRFMMTAGPFQMAPGDSQEVVVALIVGQGSDRLSSIASLKFNDTFAQDAFDRGFILPNPPAQPTVSVATDHGTVTLSWNAQGRLNYSQAGYAFEGYNVYQGATVAGPWRRIATYDEINSVRVIFDEVFDIESGQLIPEFPTAFGSDAGVQYTHTITQDAIRGGALNDATEYYFAVTSYSYGATEKPKVLENAQAVIRVKPQRYASGTDPNTASATVSYSRIDLNKPPATDVVTAEVVNPNLVTGHDYRIVFKPTSPPYPQINGADVLSSWALVDVTTGDTLLNNQLNRGSGVPNDTGLDDFQVVDGIAWRVTGQYAPAYQATNYVDNNPEHRRALTGVNWGGRGFFGGADTGWYFWGGSLDSDADVDSFTTVEVRFDQTSTQKAYRYLRLQQADGSEPAIGRGYPYTGFHDVPFTVWDAVNEVQLDAGFIEIGVTDAAGTLLDGASQEATFDSTWAPSTSADLGGREYLFLLRRPYSDTPKAEFEADAAMDNAPILFAIWCGLRAASDVIDDGDVLEFIWANPASANDVYDISTTSLVRSNASLAATGLDRIRAVPNPYYTRSNYEINQFNRVMRFINLPETCTVRIFNLGGDLVRTLDKSDVTSSVLDWDLETENGLPVASGVYIFHVDAPGVGSTFGRIAVFMETERLNNF